jgi:(p)ppGpp synthase/HD superfamily hydrolase
MQKLAEEGIAAHWRYKGLTTSEEMDKRMSWLKEILEWQKDLKTAHEFIEALKIDFFKDIIFTFTPKGQVIEMPKGAIPIDFAYMVHSDLGDKAIGAKVNRKFVSLKHELHNGDIVEIVTSKNQKPSREWLKFVKTNKARAKIRKVISAEHKVPVQTGTENKTIAKQIRKTLIEVPSGQGYLLKMSRCCNPLPGDKIIGVKKVRDISIHKSDCVELAKISREKVDAHWISDINTFVELEVGVGDISGIMTQIFNTILATGAEIESTNARKSGQTSECMINLKSKDLVHLRDIIDKIKKLQGVLWVRIGTLRM